MLSLLEGVGDGSIGMDCAVRPTKFKDIWNIQTTDFFYPLVDDPYLQGKIGCANVLSDLYSMGISDCDNMLMILAASTEMDKKYQTIVTKEMIRGFNDLAEKAGTHVTGGQTVLNPWPIIGGVATSICKSEDFILPENANSDDVLVLTKPLGTQVAVNVYQWLHQENKYWDMIKNFISKNEAIRAYDLASDSMSRLNRTAAKLMHKYGAHGATDITGFGIMGHATNLVKNQRLPLHFEIHTLPIIRSMKEVDDKVQMFSLLKGYSSETSGGLLICLPKDKAESFCREIEEIDGNPAWIIGNVKPSSSDRMQNSCRIVNNPNIIVV